MNQVFFVDFEEKTRWKDIDLRRYYNRPTFTVYLIFWISLVSFIYSHLTNNGQLLANAPLMVLQNNQYWRIFTAPFVVNTGLIELIWLLSSLWWLLSILPEHEKKYSSVHLIVEIFLQNLLLQIIYCLFVVVAVSIPGSSKPHNYEFVSQGWDPLIIIWVFMITEHIKQQKSRLFFLPFQLKNQWIAWALATWTIFFAYQKAPLVIATLLGSIQFYIFHRSAIRPPLMMYVKLQRPFEKLLNYFSSYVPIQRIKRNLQYLHPSEFEQVFGKQQYEIVYDEPDLLVFQPADIRISKEMKNEEINKWISDPLPEESAKDQTQTRTSSIFELSEERFT